jgi:hypothetical protein
MPGIARLLQDFAQWWDFRNQGIRAEPVAAAGDDCVPAYQIQLANSRVIKTAKDLEGLKIRTTGGAMDLMMRSINGVPVRMAAPEIYESLTRGTL